MRRTRIQRDQEQVPDRDGTSSSATPEQEPQPLLELQRAAGNEVVNRLVEGHVQAKLIVGSVDDPAERQADQVAEEVLQRLREGTAADIDTTAPSTAAVARAPSGTATAPAVGAGGGSPTPEVAAEIEARRAGGRPLDPAVRDRMESAFGVDFGGVRVHTGREADGLNRALGARAFATGADVFFGEGAYRPGSADGDKLLAHELAHTVQQSGQVARLGTARGGLAGTAMRAGSQADAEVIHRHASPEHLALGNLPPNRLANVAEARDLLRQLGRAGVGNPQVADAIHLLGEERKRIRKWQRQTPQSTDDDDGWGVPLVEVADGVIATYGELNTLADYFGSLEDLKSVSPGTMLKVLQTEREDYYGWLGTQLTELMRNDYVERNVTTATSDATGVHSVTRKVRFYKREKDYLRPDGGMGAPYEVAEEPGLVKREFGDTQSGLSKNLRHPLEKLVSTVSKMHGADIPILTDPGTTASGTGGAWGAIARNACHFAPESWYTWKRYHLEARAHAQRASNTRWAARFAVDEDQQETMEEQAEKAVNEAWLANGFGDHYLQDSFASGHLINKTLIMQWFLEEAKTWKFFGPSSSQLELLSLMSKKHQPHLASQELYSKDTTLSARGPQAASEEATPQEEFETAGLARPNLLTGATELLRWWRFHALHSGSRTIALGDFARIHRAVPIIENEDRLRAVLQQLQAEGFVKENRGLGLLAPDYELVKEPKWLGKEKAKSADKQYDPASTMTLAAYHEFMNSALIQSGAGALHDYFCVQGLEVSDDANHAQFKVYGDYRLLEEGAGPGVLLAGQAGEMSRAAIEDIIANGGAGTPTVDEIFARFPSKAFVPDKFGEAVPAQHGVELPLKDFLKALKPYMKEVWTKWAGEKMQYASRIPLPHARGGLVGKKVGCGAEF